MSKKAKREQKPTPVGESVAAEMETRAAYQNLIQSFTTDQNVLEAKIKEIEQAKADHSSDHSADHTPPQGSDHSSN
jgi:Spy/CpxP family protein refolding chaperone